MTALLVALGAAVGAAVRFHVAARLDLTPDARLPWGTLTVNVIGSLLLGFFVAHAIDEQTYALLGTGFCGGLTTYSAFAVQTARLGPLTWRAASYAVLTLALGVAAAALGYAVGS
ncbi:fluoride efflux transporter FluC [Nocardioides sp.]|uniref:fluoride efflux transporter FluC n=1 Tax=Nocardioides sp. TaxID=35761 RepID=UPI002B264ACE|nr:CrcB family protein [Nocardioides sp.]